VNFQERVCKLCLAKDCGAFHFIRGFIYSFISFIIIFSFPGTLCKIAENYYISVQMDNLQLLYWK